MTFDWSNFLKLAKQLASGDEASKRSAISRSYYAFFCIARDRLKRSGINVPGTGAAHDRVAELYGYSLDYESQKISKDLTREKVVRNSADYDVFFDDLSTVVDKSLKRATNGIDCVNKIPENIIDEIKKKIV